MCNENKKRYQVTIMSAIDELQRTYRALNKLYFGDALEDVIIIIQTDPKRMSYAWISVGHTWNDKTENYYREINIVAEWLNRDPDKVVASLLHEMCHLWNLQNNIQDCSRGGTYHNEKFKVAAESHGLIVNKSEKYGWCVTLPSPELTEWVNKNVRSGCFRFKKLSVWMDGTPKKITGDGEDDITGRPKVEKKGKSNIIKYVCPNCGIIVRASKNLDNKIACWDCLQNAVKGENESGVQFIMIKG